MGDGVNEVRTYRQESLADEFERHADLEGHILAEYRVLVPAPGRLCPTFSPRSA